MNQKQKDAIKARQRTNAAAMVATANQDGGDGERPPAPAPPPPRALEEIAAETRPDVGPGMPVAFMRFIDKSFQVRGQQSGEVLTANKQSNGREHRIELVRELGAFLITFIDPSRHTVEYDIVERTAVKTWRPA